MDGWVDRQVIDRETGRRSFSDSKPLSYPQTYYVWGQVILCGAILCILGC